MEGNNPVPPPQHENQPPKTPEPAVSPRDFLEKASEGVDKAAEPKDDGEMSTSTENEANLSPVERSINSSSEALAPVNTLGHEFDNLNRNTDDMISGFSGGRYAKDAIFARSTVDAAVSRFKQRIEGLPEDKKAAALDVLKSLEPYSPFEARTDDGRVISVNTFNSKEEWANFEEAAGKVTSKGEDIRNEWMDSVKKDLITNLWENPDLDEYTKMVLQWQIEKGAFDPAHEAEDIVRAAEELKRFDEELKHHSGEVVFFGDDEWSGNLKILATTDGKGVAIAKSADPNDPRRHIVFGGRTAYMVDTNFGGGDIKAYMEVRDRAELNASALKALGSEAYYNNNNERNTDNPFRGIRFGAKHNAESLNKYYKYNNNSYMDGRFGVMLNSLGIDPVNFFEDADPNTAGRFRQSEYETRSYSAQEMENFQKAIEESKKNGPPAALKG